MKIAIVAAPIIPVPPPKYGGTERVIHYLVKGLIEQGHEPILFASADSTAECEIIPTTKNALYFPKLTSKLAQFNARWGRINIKTEKLLRQNLSRFDIIHSHGFDLINFTDFPNVTTLHGPIIFKDLEYYEKRKHLNFVSISKNQQEAYPGLNYAGVVYNGEDPAVYPLIEKPSNYVSFVGRFDMEKNPHMAIELAINAGLKIKLAGKLDFFGNEYFKTYVKKYLKHPLVEYLGELDSAATARLLGRAKCNLHPTGFREPFGLTVMEAAYCGTPTLAIARGSMPELIHEGTTGLLVEDFVAGVHQVHECFGMDRIAIAKRARGLFNYQRMSREYLKIYSSIISKS